MQNLITTWNYNEININEEDLRTSETDYYSEDWISNGDFSSGSSNWYSDISGDSTDANAYISSGAANYAIDGNSGSFSLVEDGPNNSSGDWHHKTDPYFPSAADPYQDGINSEGFWFRHYFQEGSGLYTQLASRVWSRDFTLDRNISDYTITSASLTAIFNATVYEDIDVPGDWAADQSGNSITYTSSYDFGRFFLLLSDTNRNIIYEAGYYHIDSLGSGYSGMDSMSDTGLITVTGDTLIYYLTSILSQDYQTFSIALGVRVYCEDNRSPSDTDRWQYLLFNYLSLSFTYEKKMNQFTKLSWNYIGDKISGQNVSIIDGNLRFKYKIDQLWPSALSPNTRLNILINNNSLLETVKLSNAALSFEEAKTDGFDVTKLILKDINISLSIQLFLGDEFPLNQNYTISITDVYLRVIYNVYIPETEEEPWFFTGLFIIASIAAAVISGLLIAYIKVWRFPIPIRKLRKHRKALPSEKGPNVKIISREAAFRSSFHKETTKTSKYLKGAPLNGKIEKEKLFRKEAEKLIKK